MTSPPAPCIQNPQMSSPNYRCIWISLNGTKMQGSHKQGYTYGRHGCVAHTLCITREEIEPDCFYSEIVLFYMHRSGLSKVKYCHVTYVHVNIVNIVHPESFRTQSAFEFCDFLRANTFGVLIKPAREHACKRTYARNCVCIYVCERMQTRADPSACARAHTLDRICVRSERSKLISDQCHSVCDKDKAYKALCPLNGVHVRAIARTYVHANSTHKCTQTQTHANKCTQTHHCD